MARAWLAGPSFSRPKWCQKLKGGRSGARMPLRARSTRSLEERRAGLATAAAPAAAKKNWRLVVIRWLRPIVSRLSAVSAWRAERRGGIARVRLPGSRERSRRGVESRDRAGTREPKGRGRRGRFE